jgi:hypothetical protein
MAYNTGGTAPLIHNLGMTQPIYPCRQEARAGLDILEKRKSLAPPGV